MKNEMKNVNEFKKEDAMINIMNLTDLFSLVLEDKCKPFTDADEYNRLLDNHVFDDYTNNTLTTYLLESNKINTFENKVLKKDLADARCIIKSLTENNTNAYESINKLEKTNAYESINKDLDYYINKNAKLVLDLKNLEHSLKEIMKSL